MHPNDLRDIARYVLRAFGHHPSDVAWLKDAELLEQLHVLDVHGTEEDLVRAVIALIVDMEN